MSDDSWIDRATARLEQAGLPGAELEVAALRWAAGDDEALFDQLLERRVAGEPLAWLLGEIEFCGERLIIQPGVYVPRYQTQEIAEAAAARLPAYGIAVDLCTGSGAVAAVLARRRPGAVVLATEVDPVAAACARANGVDVRVGDLAEPLPRELDGRVDVVCGVVPYVASEDVGRMPADVLAFEPRVAFDGGAAGIELLVRAVAAAARLLKPGGALVLELGGDAAWRLEPVLAEHGFADLELVIRDGRHLAVIATR